MEEKEGDKDNPTFGTRSRRPVVTGGLLTSSGSRCRRRFPKVVLSFLVSLSSCYVWYGSGGGKRTSDYCCLMSLRMRGSYTVDRHWLVNELYATSYTHFRRHYRRYHWLGRHLHYGQKPMVTVLWWWRYGSMKYRKY